MEPQIANISLGSSRRFKLKTRNRKDTPPKEIENVEPILGSGCLVIMKYGTNANYVHGVMLDPKYSPENFRINMTFRNYTYDSIEKELPAAEF